MKENTMFNNREHLKTRNPERSDDVAGIALPQRVSGKLFPGWGPKLMLAAFAVGALAVSNRPASAATAVAQAACGDHGAVLVSSPVFGAPDGMSGNHETVLRIDLTASGRIANLAVAQSSGDPILDFEAIRVARESRYAAAVDGCKPAADSFLYRVTFPN
jgi:TonB family protein